MLLEIPCLLLPSALNVGVFVQESVEYCCGRTFTVPIRCMLLAVHRRLLAFDIERRPHLTREVRATPVEDVNHALLGMLLAMPRLRRTCVGVVLALLGKDAHRAIRCMPPAVHRCLVAPLTLKVGRVSYETCPQLL